MNACSWCSCLIFAQISRFDGLRDRFSGPRSRFKTEDAITAVAVMVGIAVVLYLVNRWHSRRSGKQSYNSPSAMFRELCEAHNLDRKTRQLLQQVARWQGLSQPARLFLEPERYELANLSPELARHSAELFELRSKLFTFEVQPESRDTLDYHPVAATKEKSLAEAMQSALQPEARTEAIGAAAFATTRLESAESHSEA